MAAKLFELDCFFGCVYFYRIERYLDFTRFGGYLLSHDLSRSTIGVTVLNFRVRDGTGCFTCAMTTKPRKIQIRCADLDLVGVRVFCEAKCSGNPQRIHAGRSGINQVLSKFSVVYAF